MTSTMSLSPEAEARIAALPPERQARVRAMMNGSKAVSTTNSSCVAPNTTVDSLLNQQEQKDGAMKCTITNRAINSSGGSFDTNCTSDSTTVAAHTEFTKTDAEHVTGKTHMVMNSTRNGRTLNSSSDSIANMRYVGADCGDVKPIRGSARSN
jgi:predicted membrane-bound mannosyltransferase